MGCLWKLTFARGKKWKRRARPVSKGRRSRRGEGGRGEGEQEYLPDAAVGVVHHRITTILRI